MTFNNYTQKSLEAVQSAQNIAVQHSNQQLEQIHLLLSLLQQDGGLTPQLLRKMGITIESLEAAAMAEVKKLPADPMLPVPYLPLLSAMQSLLSAVRRCGRSHP